MTAASTSDAHAATTATSAATTTDTANPATNPAAVVLIAVAAAVTTTAISADTAVSPVRQPSPSYQQIFPYDDSWIYWNPAFDVVCHRPFQTRKICSAMYTLSLVWLIHTFSKIINLLPADHCLIGGCVEAEFHCIKHHLCSNISIYSSTLSPSKLFLIDSSWFRDQKPLSWKNLLLIFSDNFFFAYVKLATTT